MKAEHHSKRGSSIVDSNEWEALILANKYKALIFDCDGTLVESGNAHFNSFREAVRAQGEDLDQVWYSERTGLDRRSLLSKFSSIASPAFDVERAITQSVSAFATHVSLVQAIPETSHLLRRFSSSLPIAVGTNAEADIATASLTATGLIDFVRFISSVSDGLAPKPSPDIFIAAAAKLECASGSALVIEDSRQGVLAAKAAGMDVLCLER